MSDTPISDSTPHNVAELGMLCRKIERELHAANSIIRQQQLLDEQNLRLQERIKRLEEALAAYLDLLGTDGVEQGVAVVREMKDRIKRLEEAGDAIDPMNDSECECDSGYVVVCKHCFDRSENWRKAKEAKL
jgi:hypothetical protein